MLETGEASHCFTNLARLRQLRGYLLSSAPETEECSTGSTHLARPCDMKGISQMPNSAQRHPRNPAHGSTLVRHSALRTYIAEDRMAIPGWLDIADCLLLVALDCAQRGLGVVGNILEIGVYHGASAILLGYLKRPDERFLVCDLFGSPGLHPANDLERAQFAESTRAAFEANYSRYHSQLPEVLAVSSIDLVGRLPKADFRVVHVDGSHAYDDVRSDIRLAHDLLAPGGVVVLDDAVAPHLPGTVAAVWEAVACDKLIPFALANKLYASWGPPPRLDPHPLAAELGLCLETTTHDVRGYGVKHYQLTSRARPLRPVPWWAMRT